MKTNFKLIYALCFCGAAFTNCKKQTEIASAVAETFRKGSTGAVLAISDDPTQKIDNDVSQYWTDVSTNEILNQGGSIVRGRAGTSDANTYHWFGIQYNVSPLQPWTTKAINHYISTDLVHWTKRTAAYTTTATSYFANDAVLARPMVLWDGNSGKNYYVMVLSVKRPGDTRNSFEFLTAPDLNSGTTWTPQPTKAFNTVTDIAGTSNLHIGATGAYADGNTAYVLYTFDAIPPPAGSTYSNAKQGILKLGTDFMTPVSTNHTVANTYVEFDNSTSGAHQEAPRVFKNNGYYYFFTSVTNGWEPSHTQYRVSSSMMSGWTDKVQVPTNPVTDNSFFTQNNGVVEIAGSAGSVFMYIGDRWFNFYGANNPTPPGPSRDAWFPMTFDNSAGGAPVPIINAPKYDNTNKGGYWYLNASLGKWGTDNLLANGGFEDGSYLNNWVVTGTTPNQSSGTSRYEGLAGVSYPGTLAYTSTLTNSTATACALGTYKVSVRLKGASAVGKFNTLNLVATVGTNTYTLPITGLSTTVFNLYQIPDFYVSTQSDIKVQLVVNGTTGAWLQVDDFRITRN